MDWFEPSIVGVPVEDIERVLLSYVPGEFVELEHGAMGYAHQRRGPAGSQIFYDDRRPEVHVVLRGEWCSSLDEASMRGLLTWARPRVSNVSRLDLFGDDLAKRATPADVSAAVMQRGELVTHTRVRGYQEDHTDSTLRGATYTFGRRGSRMYLRTYDKGAQSHGETDAIRWEVEARDDAANALLQILPTVKAWGQIWADAVSSFVDFRERWASSNVSLCPRVAWFDSLVGDVEKWSPYAGRAPRTVEDLWRWLERQVGPSLAAVLLAAGGDVSVLTELAASGRDRLRPSHRVMVAQFLAREEAAA